MISKLQYQYSILRYKHDVRTEEFLNVGVFFWVPEDSWCDFLFTEKPNRVLAAFPNVEKDELISVLKEIRSRICSINTSSKTGVLSIAHEALPPDDSSLKWSAPRSGRAINTKAALERVYSSFVTRYQPAKEKHVRSDWNVWHDFSKNLKLYNILGYFRRGSIKTPMKSYRFDHVWHSSVIPQVIATISLDAGSEKEMADKTVNWVGQIGCLSKSNDNFKLHIVLGKPSKKSLDPLYKTATGMLKEEVDAERMDIFNEQDSPILAEKLAKEIHAQNPVSDTRNTFSCSLQKPRYTTWVSCFKKETSLLASSQNGRRYGREASNFASFHPRG